MTDLEMYVTKQISSIIPNFEKIDFRANVGDSSFSVEFFATVNGKNMQCYDMVDEGLIKEDDLDIISKNIAAFIRGSADYQKNSINKVKFSLVK